MWKKKTLTAYQIKRKKNHQAIKSEHLNIATDNYVTCLRLSARSSLGSKHIPPPSFLVILLGKRHIQAHRHKHSHAHTHAHTQETY